MRDFLHFADIILCFLDCCCCCFSLSLCEQHRGISQSNKSYTIEYDGDDDGHDDSVHIFFSVLYIVYTFSTGIYVQRVVVGDLMVHLAVERIKESNGGCTVDPIEHRGRFKMIVCLMV